VTGCLISFSVFFYVCVTVHRKNFLFNKTDRRTNFPSLFCQETLHVSGSSFAHHQEFSTVHLALVYIMQFWWQLSSCHQNCMTYTSAECTVENCWWWAKELPETCRVSWQNKLEKSVRLLALLNSNHFSIFFFRWPTALLGSRLLRRGFDITLRHTTLGTTPLDKKSAPHWDLHMTTHNIRKRQTSIPPTVVETENPASEWP